MTGPNAEQDLQATAYHEAAHAVIGSQMGLMLISVSIVSTATSLGLTLFDPPCVPIRDLPFGSQEKLDRLELHATVCLVGEFAEEKYMASIPPHGFFRIDEHGKFGAHGSHVKLVEEIMVQHHNEFESLKGWTWPDYFRHLNERARAIVEYPLVWSRITALAAALLERQILSGKEARAIFMAVR